MMARATGSSGRENARGASVEVHEPTRLAFTWRFDHEPEEVPALVTVDLTEVDDATTRLRLTHSGHTNAEDRDGTAEGWDLSLARLTTALT